MTATARRAGEAGDGAARAAAALLKTVYPGGARHPSHSPNWPDCARLTPHVRALYDTGHMPATAAMDTLLNHAGIFLEAMADYATYVEFAQAALDLKKMRLPPDHRGIAAGQATLGHALRRSGNLDDAEDQMRRAVALDRAHGPDSADLAGTLNLLGGVLIDKGRAGPSAALHEAVTVIEQARDLHQKLSGAQSDAVALCPNALAVAHNARGAGTAAAAAARHALALSPPPRDPRGPTLRAGSHHTGS